MRLEVQVYADTAMAASQQAKALALAMGWRKVSAVRVVSVDDVLNREWKAVMEVSK